MTGYYADITEIYKEMVANGVTPQIVSDLIEGVQPMSREAFEACHTLMKFKKVDA